MEVQMLGAGEILLNSIDRDGTKEGYDIELIKQVSSAVDIPVIASGGAGSLEHLPSPLIEGRADAVLVASMLHFNQASVRKIKEYLSLNGVNVRW
jgi:cyclase